MANDLKTAVEALYAKNTPYTSAWQYYDGDQPLVYSANRLKEAFRNIDARFCQNWCAVVVDSVLDRLTLKGFDAQDKTTNDALDEIWTRIGLQLDSYDAHLGALVCGEAYLIAWKDESDQTQAWYNDPRLCEVFYDPENPKRKSFAAKWWKQDDNTYRLTLYYPERIEHYTAKSTFLPQTYGSFLPDENAVERNEYGVIPVFHLRNSRRGKNSLLANVVYIQDAVNKLLADMMVAAEFGAWVQRWVISNSDLSDIKNNPYSTWVLPAGDGEGQQTQVGQFQAAQLDNFLNAIDKLANSIAIITRTPKHYFYSAGSGISGEALLAMEAPLVKKVKAIQENYATTWQEIAAFLLKLEGKGDFNPSDLTPVWEPVGSIQPYTEAQALKTNIDAGIPLETLLRRNGWGQDEIDQLKKDIAEADKAKSSMAQTILSQMRVQDEQSNTPPSGEVESNQPSQG